MVMRCQQNVTFFLGLNFWTLPLSCKVRDWSPKVIKKWNGGKRRTKPWKFSSGQQCRRTCRGRSAPITWIKYVGDIKKAAQLSNLCFVAKNAQSAKVLCHCFDNIWVLSEDEMFEKSCFKPGGKNRYYRDKLLLREEKTFSLVCWGFVWPHLAGDQSREEVVWLVLGPWSIVHSVLSRATTSPNKQHWPLLAPTTMLDESQPIKIEQGIENLLSPLIVRGS